MEKYQKLTSHFERYISATQEQETPTKFLKNKSHLMIINVAFIIKMLKI